MNNDSSQTSNEKATGDRLPKGMIRGFLDGRNFALPGLRLDAGSILLVFADYDGQSFKNKITMRVRPENLGSEVEIPEQAHFEIMEDGIEHFDAKGKVKLESVPVFPGKKFKGTVEVKFDGGRRTFTGGTFDLSEE